MKKNIQREKKQIEQMKSSIQKNEEKIQRISEIQRTREIRKTIERDMFVKHKKKSLNQSESSVDESDEV